MTKELKFKAIAVEPGRGIYALSESGDVWRKHGAKWEKIPGPECHCPDKAEENQKPVELKPQIKK